MGLAHMIKAAEAKAAAAKKGEKPGAGKVRKRTKSAESGQSSPGAEEKFAPVTYSVGRRHKDVIEAARRRLNLTTASAALRALLEAGLK